jgi:hypothetical protein
MSIVDLYNAFGVVYQTEGHKHCRPGWANTECPFCQGNKGYHLGCNINSGYFYCWRCGWKAPGKAIAKLLAVQESKAQQLIREYKVRSGHRKSISTDRKIQFKPFKIPSNCHSMSQLHRRYLEGRGFDPDKLEAEWGLLGTGPVSFLDGIDYRHRIVAPIIWEGSQVSFQARDATGKSNMRYLACPKAREFILHQRILYGKDWNKDIGICVEGITDVWRLGPAAFAIFGIEFTPSQVRWMGKLFKRIIILFDDDPQAVRQGKILQAELEFRGVEVRQESIEGDPGGMKQDEANHLVREVLKWR